MRIGIDCRSFYDVALNEGAGIERYTYHLVKNLLAMDKTNQYVLFFYGDLSPETIHRVKANNPRVKIVKLFQRRARFPFWDNHWRFSRLLKKEQLDWTIFPANVIPLFYRRQAILVVHDLAIYLHPEWFPGRQWLATKIIVPHSIKRATKIVAISENTKNDLQCLFHVPAKRVQVIYPGITIKNGYLTEESEAVKKKFTISSDYILFIGTLEPRKNASRLIKAFTNYIFGAEEDNVVLVLAGIRGWKFQPFFRELNETNKRIVGSRIKYIGKITNRERNILIKNCQFFVFPSLSEGFGFPQVEAMALGVPVLAGDNSALKEIGVDCAFLVNAEDSNDITRGIRELRRDKFLRQHLVVLGKQRASQFNWGKTANEFLSIMENR